MPLPLRRAGGSREEKLRSSGGVVIVCEVEDAIEVVAKRVIDCRCHIHFMDHVRVLVAGAGKGPMLLDSFGKLSSGAIDLCEAKDTDMPSELRKRMVEKLRLNEDFRLF